MVGDGSMMQHILLQVDLIMVTGYLTSDFQMMDGLDIMQLIPIVHIIHLLEVSITRTIHIAEQLYEIDVKIPIKGSTTSSRYGPTGTVKNSLTLATEIATKVASTLTNPTFETSGITTAFVSQLGSNRISFKTIDGVPYDLTNAGIAPIRVGTEELTGTVDGYYNIDAASDTQIKTFLNTKVPKRELSKACRSNLD